MKCQPSLCSSNSLPERSLSYAYTLQRGLLSLGEVWSMVKTVVLSVCAGMSACTLQWAHMEHLAGQLCAMPSTPLQISGAGAQAAPCLCCKISCECRSCRECRRWHICLQVAQAPQQAKRPAGPAAAITAGSAGPPAARGSARRGGGRCRKARERTAIRRQVRCTCCVFTCFTDSLKVTLSL